MSTKTNQRDWLANRAALRNLTSSAHAEIIRTAPDARVNDLLSAVTSYMFHFDNETAAGARLAALLDDDSESAPESAPTSLFEPCLPETTLAWLSRNLLQKLHTISLHGNDEHNTTFVLTPLVWYVDEQDGMLVIETGMVQMMQGRAVHANLDLGQLTIDLGRCDDTLAAFYNALGSALATAVDACGRAPDFTLTADALYSIEPNRY